MTRVVRQRAFTLIEVLIALSLTGLVLVTATRMARFSLELEQQVRRQDLLQIRADVLFDQIQEDLQGILQDSTAAAARRSASCLQKSPTGWNRFMIRKT